MPGLLGGSAPLAWPGSRRLPRRLREKEVEACELERAIEIPDPFLIPDYPNAPGMPRNEPRRSSRRKPLL